MGLGGWLCLMLRPLTQFCGGPLDPQVGSALVLLYPAAIAYATVRYRLFDATVVIRRSVDLRRAGRSRHRRLRAADRARRTRCSPRPISRARPGSRRGSCSWSCSLFNPLRERVRRAVDRTFFRERPTTRRAIQALARSMRSLLDLDEIVRRLTTTIESAMHVNRAPRSRTAPPRPPGRSRVAPGALSRYQVEADPRFAARAGPPGAWETLRRRSGGAAPVPGRAPRAAPAGRKRSEAPTSARIWRCWRPWPTRPRSRWRTRSTSPGAGLRAALERSLLIRGSLAKFVPHRVRQLIEESPEAPSLDKRETEVSVLFADISGYTRLSSRLPPDELEGSWSGTSAPSSTRSSSTAAT